MYLVSVTKKFSTCLRHSPTRLPLLLSSSSLHHHQIHSTTRINAKRKKDAESEPAVNLQDYTEEQQLKFIRDAEYLSQKQGIDIWATPTETLDVQIPYTTAPWSKSKYSSFRERIDQWLSNQQNKFKNMFSMMRIISYQSLPGIDLPSMGLLKLLRTPVQICTCTSTKPTSWTAPMRKIFVDNYVELQQALAKHDKTTVSKLTEVPYFTEATKLLKKSSSSTYFWTLHRHLSPPKILSIRAMEGHLGSAPPRYGNRLVVQALVRFDSEQSLEIYNPQGKALHTPPSPSSSLSQTQPSTQPSTSTSQSPSPIPSSKRTPAEKHRLTEYYIFEKKMYMNTPWQVKERLYPRAGRVVLG
ncbi:hypothetical protein GYMLUDRAFT_49003 [Collybiopsis luxurians FD-317 M1]|uniref:Uncharacterized protein n=1 Tax=Collybiopsis luxurians FD-317 M1 TaxID=944289 RepID=A0A0D0BHE3_9AGAR|nr:hypothetical protein GYMLUDRAFT_49003 [Collybiopsis luxurians FD-317 M1]